MTRVRIGIAVGHERMGLLTVRGGSVRAAARCDLGGDGELEEAVSGLLAEQSLPRFPRPVATLALGPSRSQLRMLDGLPESSDARQLGQVVRLDPGRFFLRNGTPLMTTELRPLLPGVAWAGALDELAVAAVQRACAAAGVRLAAATPLPVALAHQLPAGVFLWPDGPVTAELEVEASEVAALRRRCADASEVDDLPIPPGLADLGPHAADFKDAYAAALLPAREPLVVRFAAEQVPRWRLGVAAAALVLALALAVLLPALRTREAARVAGAELERLAPAALRSVRTGDELVEVTQALREVEGFAAGRRSVVAVIARLARDLPEGSALAGVQADSAGGTLVVLTPRAAEVLAAVERMPRVGRAALTGPVTREAIGDRQLERAAIRFVWEPAP